MDVVTVSVFVKVQAGVETWREDYDTELRRN
jgi:hypothetical protein